MGVYKVPKERLHRDFFYLDDEVVINSLSVLESGKIDEIVSRVTTAREGGFSGELKIPAVDAGVGGNKKSHLKSKKRWSALGRVSRCSMPGIA